MYLPYEPVRPSSVGRWVGGLVGRSVGLSVRGVKFYVQALYSPVKSYNSTFSTFLQRNCIIENIRHQEVYAKIGIRVHVYRPL